MDIYVISTNENRNQVHNKVENQSLVWNTHLTSKSIKMTGKLTKEVQI